METVPAQAAPTDRRAVGIWRVVGLVAYALTPILSLGYGSWLAFLVAAIRYSHLGRRVAGLLWGSTGVLLTAAAGMVATADTASGTPADRVFVVCALVAFIGGTVEAVVLALVAAALGYQGRTPRRSPDRGRADASEPVSPAPQPATDQAAPEVGQPTGRPPARYRRLWWILGLSIFGLMTAMSLALYQFDHATSCTVANPSHPCIRSLQGTITAPGWSEDIPGYNGDITTKYYFVATLRESGRRVDVWSFQPQPHLRVGDAVVLERWKGHYITVTSRSHRVEVNGWEPQVLTWLLVLLYGSAAVAALLRRAGLLSLDEHPRGRLSMLRSILGWTFLTSAAALTCITIPWALSAPQLYLRWW